MFVFSTFYTSPFAYEIILPVSFIHFLIPLPIRVVLLYILFLSLGRSSLPYRSSHGSPHRYTTPSLSFLSPSLYHPHITPLLTPTRPSWPSRGTVLAAEGQFSGAVVESRGRGGMRSPIRAIGWVFPRASLRRREAIWPRNALARGSHPGHR